MRRNCHRSLEARWKRLVVADLGRPGQILREPLLLQTVVVLLAFHADCTAILEIERVG